MGKLYPAWLSGICDLLPRLTTSAGASLAKMDYTLPRNLILPGDLPIGNSNGSPASRLARFSAEVSTMPTYSIARSAEIHAPPARVYEVICDYGTWTRWSPWLCAEPDAHVSVTADASSVGSIYSWKGQLVGEGEIEHRRLEPHRLIDDEIRFRKPFKSHSRVSFELRPTDVGTRVTWRMQGTLPWFMFWMRSMVETFVGMDYERGLKMLGEWIETGQVLSRTRIVGVNPLGPWTVGGLRRTCALGDVGSSVAATFQQASAKFAALGLPREGPAVTVYHRLDMKRKTFDYTSGFVLPESAQCPAELSRWSIPRVQALQVEHVGSYKHLGNAWSAAQQVARYKKLRQARLGTLEVYENDPQTTSAGELRTQIYLPLK